MIPMVPTSRGAIASPVPRGGWLTATVWLVNLPIAAAVIVVVMRFVLAPPSPATPAYVPEAYDLPSFEPAALADWDELTWTRSRPVSQRDVDGPVRRTLHDANAADWNRRPPVPWPDPKQSDDDREQVEIAPTIEEALRDLQQRIVVKAFRGGSHVVVSLVHTPATEYVLVDAARWARYVEDVEISSSREISLNDVRGMLHHDLHSVNLPLTAIAIGRHSWTVEYTYRGTAFTLTLGPPRLNSSVEIGTGETGFDSLSEVLKGGSGSGNGAANASRTHRAERAPDVPGEPEPPRSSMQVSPDTWLLIPDEVQHVQENLGRLIEELRPESVFNRETREYEGIRLTEVPEDSLARRRGFVGGDTIISVNGSPVRSVTDVKNYVRSNRNLAQYVVVFDRNGTRQTRTFRVSGR